MSAKCQNRRSAMQQNLFEKWQQRVNGRGQLDCTKLYSPLPSACSVVRLSAHTKPLRPLENCTVFAKAESTTPALGLSRHCRLQGRDLKSISYLNPSCCFTESTSPSTQR